MMAEAVGKATGRPGICFVTRGPGATNASAGLHIARQDSTPMILFVGQIARDMREREAFQELDYRAVFGSMAKWATEIDDPARMPEIVSRAFYTATSGRPGPVVIALPEDMLVERIAAADAPPFEPVETSPGAADMARLQKMLAGGGAADRHRRRQPLVGGRLRGTRAFRRTLRRAGRDFVPPREPVRSAASQLRRRPRHRRQSEADRAHQARRSHRADRRPARRAAVAALHAARHPRSQANIRARASRRRRTRPRLSPRILRSTPRRRHLPRRSKRSRRRKAFPGARRRTTAHADFLAWTDKPSSVPGRVNMGEIVVGLRDKLPADAVISNGAGNFSIWVHRFTAIAATARSSRRPPARWAMACRRRSAMKRLAPERTVVAFAGDGDFLMNGQEFATAVQYDLPIIVDPRGQRHVRHHPHAPGARISRPRRRDRAAQSRFRRVRARLWRLRRDGREAPPSSRRRSRRRRNPASRRCCT